MVREQRVSTLKPGDVFRDWLVHVLGDRIRNKSCDVAVYKIGPASHTVCRYEFKGENCSVVAKFYAEPTGTKRDYNAKKSMDREYAMLKRVAEIIDVPRPIAARAEFSCALVTEHVRGRPLYRYMKNEDGLYDRLTAIAHLLRRLHDSTECDYRKQYEFSRFHRILDDLRLDSSAREMYNRLLGEWWYGSLLDRHRGCLIHNDPNPVNYIFHHDRVYALDFESAWDQANPVHDLGVMAAELKHYFALHRGDGGRAEPYIGHFLWQYSRGLEEFRSITRALPFFMSLGLLRIARLDIDPDRSAWIFKEALACLSSPNK